MLRWLMTVNLTATSDEPFNRDEAKKFCRDVLAELEALGGVNNDLTAELPDGEIEITVGLTQEGLSDAIGNGLSMVRCAVHAAGASTPNWPDHQEIAADTEGKWAVTFESVSHLMPA